MCRIEELIANGAEGRELTHVGHEGRQLDQVGRARADRCERGHEILKRLGGLRSEIIGTDYRTGCIERDLTGDEDQIAACYDRNLAVAKDSRKGRRVDEVNLISSSLRAEHGARAAPASTSAPCAKTRQSPPDSRESVARGAARTR